MPGKIYLDLLILCVIWSQGIIGTFADENITESSSYRVRQKRVISHVSGEEGLVRIEESPYIVSIKFNNRVHCVGTILSHRIIITAAECVQSDKTRYKIISSSSRTNRAVSSHNVIEIKRHVGNQLNGILNGIALLTIDPAIVYSTKENKIDLHVEPVLPGMIGTITGWGYNVRNTIEPGTNFPSELRSIEVPIIAHRDCVNRYRAIRHISDEDICTFHPRKHSGHTDIGAPLVIDNLLVGILIQMGPSNQIRFYNHEYPEVFAFLQETNYRNWILANI